MNNYNLQRFVDAQRVNYDTALREIKEGRKRSCWIWYIFPQLSGLGSSYNARYFGIRSLKEAQAYLQHPQLRANLIEISQALLEQECSNAVIVMGGYPDDKKLQSSMTLFAAAEPECEVFQRVLDKYFGGEKDQRTLNLIGKK